MLLFKCSLNALVMYETGIRHKARQIVGGEHMKFSIRCLNMLAAV